MEIPISKGYSGHGEGLNNPAMQDDPNVGPIPRGFYEIDEPIFTSEHGPYALPLIPLATNEMFSRSGFLMHGDRLVGPAHQASEGCIIQPFSTRKAVWESADHQLEVVE